MSQSRLNKEWTGTLYAVRGTRATGRFPANWQPYTVPSKTVGRDRVDRMP